MDLPPSSGKEGLPRSLPGHLARRFRPRRVLGRGASATVYLADDAELSREVVLKILDGELSGTEVGRGLFAREARILSEIRSHRVVTLLDAGFADGQAYLVYPFLPGRPLDQVLAADGPVPVDILVRYFDEILEGLALLRELEVVHRDLKPQNVLVGPHGCLLIDFGLARCLVDPVKLTRTGDFCGTPQFAAPDQIRGHPVDHRDDLYALGWIAYVALTGEHPYRFAALPLQVHRQLNETPPTPEEVSPRVPRRLSRWVMRLLEKERRLRPEDAMAARQELARVGAATPAGARERPAEGTAPLDVEVPASSPTQRKSGSRGRRRRRRRRRRLGGPLLVLTVLLGAGAITWAVRRGAPGAPPSPPHPTTSPEAARARLGGLLEAPGDLSAKDLVEVARACVSALEGLPPGEAAAHLEPISSRLRGRLASMAGAGSQSTIRALVMARRALREGTPGTHAVLVDDLLGLETLRYAVALPDPDVARLGTQVDAVRELESRPEPPFGLSPEGPDRGLCRALLLQALALSYSLPAGDPEAHRATLAPVLAGYELLSFGAGLAARDAAALRQRLERGRTGSSSSAASWDPAELEAAASHAAAELQAKVRQRVGWGAFRLDAAVTVPGAAPPRSERHYGLRLLFLRELQAALEPGRVQLWVDVGRLAGEYSGEVGIASRVPGVVEGSLLRRHLDALDLATHVGLRLQMDPDALFARVGPLGWAGMRWIARAEPGLLPRIRAWVERLPGGHPVQAMLRARLAIFQRRPLEEPLAGALRALDELLQSWEQRSHSETGRQVLLLGTRFGLELFTSLGRLEQVGDRLDRLATLTRDRAERPEDLEGVRREQRALVVVYLGYRAWKAKDLAVLERLREELVHVEGRSEEFATEARRLLEGSDPFVY